MKDNILVSAFSYANAIFALAFNIILMTYLSKDDFGIWSITVSTAAICASILILGFPKAYQNQVASGVSINLELFTLAALRAVGLAIFFGLFYSLFDNNGQNFDIAYISTFIFLIIHFVLLEFGLVAAQLGHCPRKVYIMTGHGNFLRLFFYFGTMLSFIFFNKSISYEIIAVSIGLQVLFTFVLVYFYIFSKRVSNYQLLLTFASTKETNFFQKRIWFFGSNVSFVFSAYMGIILLGSSTSVDQVADFQVVLLLINFCMIIPNAIFVKLLGSRIQEGFNNKTIKSKKVYQLVFLMTFMGAFISLLGYTVLSIIIDNFFPSYSLRGSMELILVVLIVAARFAVSYPFALMNSGDVIYYKTKIQYFSIFLFFLAFYLLPIKDPVLLTLTGYLVADIARTILGIIWIKRSFSNEKIA